MDELVDPGPLGYKRPYEVSEVDLLEAGDLLLLYTDGFTEHGGDRYLAERAEGVLETVPESERDGDLRAPQGGPARLRSARGRHQLRGDQENGVAHPALALPVS